jgi:hypothetical protein
VYEARNAIPDLDQPLAGLGDQAGCWLLKVSPSPAACLLPCAVMLFSVSIVYVVISLFPLYRRLRSWHSSLWSAEQASQFCGGAERILGERLVAAARLGSSPIRRGTTPDGHFFTDGVPYLDFRRIVSRLSCGQEQPAWATGTSR